MVKKILVISLMVWISFSHASKNHPMVQDSIKEAESYKVEKAVEEQDAQRSVAGSKIKKMRPVQEEAKEDFSSSDPEVRPWKYSEEESDDLSPKD